MKKVTLLLIGLTIMMSSCLDQEDSITPLETQKSAIKAKSNPLTIYDISKLTVSDISNGFFYLVDKKNYITAFVDGKVVCADDFPKQLFKRTNIRKDANPGIYITKSTPIRYTPDLVITINPNFYKNCVTEVTYEFPCDPGEFGFIEYTTETCYNLFTGELISIERKVIRSRDCIKWKPVFDKPVFEDVNGDEIENPICRIPNLNI